MPSTALLVAFFATTAVFAFIPGPAMLYAAARTLAGGRRAGMTAALGIHMGGYIHVLAATVSLSVLFRAVPLLYAVIRLAGACYLIWLGIAMLRGERGGEVAVSASTAKSGWRAFGESAIVEILNPKTAIFFVAFLPQFIDAAAAPVWLQFAGLGVIVNLMFSVADVICVLLAGLIVARLRRSRSARRIMQRAGGALLIGLGTHVILQRN